MRRGFAVYTGFFFSLIFVFCDVIVTEIFYEHLSKGIYSVLCKVVLFLHWPALVMLQSNFLHMRKSKCIWRIGVFFFHLL